MNPLAQPPMEGDTENNSKAGSTSMPQLEGIPVEEEVVESPLGYFLRVIILYLSIVF